MNKDQLLDAIGAMSVLELSELQALQRVPVQRQ